MRLVEEGVSLPKNNKRTSSNHSWKVVWLLDNMNVFQQQILDAITKIRVSTNKIYYSEYHWVKVKLR